MLSAGLVKSPVLILFGLMTYRAISCPECDIPYTAWWCREPDTIPGTCLEEWISGCLEFLDASLPVDTIDFMNPLEKTGVFIPDKKKGLDPY